ncbi:MAG: DnaA ATPase domain-containing protein, partial [Planctomycetia bacterium]
TSRYALEKFLVADCNRAAYAAVSGTVADPRRTYSPVFVYGSAGTGKTHLLKGLEDGLRRRHPQLKVVSYSCEEFTNQFLEAMHAGKLNGFRSRLRKADVLVVDDVHFLAGKTATQSEFFHTLESMERRSALVVLASLVHPRQMQRLGEEVRSRLLSGILSRIEPPCPDFRLKFLEEAGRQRGLALPAETREFLAARLKSSVGQLEGAVNFLEHYAGVFGGVLDVPTVRKALGDVLRTATPVLRPADVKRQACDLFGLDPALIDSRGRTKSVTHPRMLVLYLARKRTTASYNEIGREIGSLNHTTVMSAVKRIEAMLADDAEIALGGRVWKVRDAVEAFDREFGS